MDVPNAPAVIEADDVPEDEFNPMDPATSSPLVAWLASDESQHVTGQVIRAVGDKIVLMKGWSDGPPIATKKRWDATKLDQTYSDRCGLTGPEVTAGAYYAAMRAKGIGEKEAKCARDLYANLTVEQAAVFQKNASAGTSLLRGCGIDPKQLSN